MWFLAYLCYCDKIQYPRHKQSEIQSTLDYFEKNNQNENMQWFWEQNGNLKYSIVVEQSISKPGLVFLMYLYPHVICILVVVFLVQNSACNQPNGHTNKLVSIQHWSISIVNLVIGHTACLNQFVFRDEYYLKKSQFWWCAFKRFQFVCEYIYELVRKIQNLLTVSFIKLSVTIMYIDLEMMISEILQFGTKRLYVNLHACCVDLLLVTWAITQCLNVIEAE